MLNIAVFGATVSYVLMMLAHIVLRSREPDLERGYRTPGGTATSGVALVLALLAVVATFLVDEKAALITLGVYAAAAAYFFFYSRHHLVSSAPEEEFAAITSAESELKAVTAEQLRRAVGDGSIDTVLLVFADMQGRLQGKRLVGQALRRGGARARRRGLQLPAGRRRRDEHGRGLRDVVVVHGLRRLRDEAATWRRSGRCPGTTAPRCAWPTSCGTTSRPSSPRRGRSCAASSTGSRSAAGRRWPPRSSSSSCSATPTRRRSTRAIRDLVPGNQYNVDYSILGTSRLEPLLGRIRREMAAAGPRGGELQGRVQLRPARDQLHLRGALGAADTHTIYKNGAKEIASQEGDGHHVHGEVQRARGQLVPHPPVAADRGRQAGVRRQARAVRPLPRRAARVPARADAVQGAEHQLLQALRGGLVRPHRGRVGP